MSNRRLNLSTTSTDRPAARSPDLAKDLMKLRIHLRNKYQTQITQWRAEQGARPDGEMRSIQELVGWVGGLGGGGGGGGLGTRVAAFGLGGELNCESCEPNRLRACEALAEASGGTVAACCAAAEQAGNCPARPPPGRSPMRSPTPRPPSTRAPRPPSRRLG